MVHSSTECRVPKLRFLPNGETHLHFRGGLSRWTCVPVSWPCPTIPTRCARTLHRHRWTTTVSTFCGKARKSVSRRNSMENVITLATVTLVPRKSMSLFVQGFRAGHFRLPLRTFRVPARFSRSRPRHQEIAKHVTNSVSSITGQAAQVSVVPATQVHIRRQTADKIENVGAPTPAWSAWQQPCGDFPSMMVSG